MDNGVPPTSKRPGAQQGVKPRPPAQPDPRSETVVPGPNGTGAGASTGNGTGGTNGNGNANGSGGAVANASRNARARAGALAKKAAPKSRARPADGTAARSHRDPLLDSAPPTVATALAAELAAGLAAESAGTTAVEAEGTAVAGGGKGNGLISAPLDPSVWAHHTLTASEPVLLPTIVPADGSPAAKVAPTTEPAPAEPVAHSTRELIVLPPLVPSAMPVFVPAPEFTDTDGTDGMPSLAKPIKPPRPLRKPKVVARRRPRPRVRKVTRVVRHVDTWSVFKVAVVFNLFLYGVGLTAGVLLWQVAQNTGTVDNIERFFENFGWETFQLKGGEIFHNAWIAGLFVVVGLTGLAVLMATLFNLITDLVGGIRVSVLEEEVIAREDRGIGWRRGRRLVYGGALRSPADSTEGDGGPPQPA